MSKLKFHIVLMFALLFLASCGSHRKNVTPTETMLTEALIQQVEQNETQWNWFTAKLNIQPESGMISNFGGQIRMQRDSVIWISVTALLGVEAARIMITPDSLFVINKLENAYAKESFEKLKMRYGTEISFLDIQNTLLGNSLWMLGTGEKTRELDNPYYKLGNTLNYDRIWVEQQHFRTAKTYHAERFFQLRTTYDGFETFGSNLIPTEIGLDLKGMYTFAGKMKYSSVTLNETTSFPFKVTSKMKRIRL